jgi:hypothetical protein
MKVKDIEELHRLALGLELPENVGEMEVHELFAWSEACEEDARARLAENERQLTIAEEFYCLLKTVDSDHTEGLTMHELIRLLPEPPRSRALKLIEQMPKYIQIS